MISPAPGSNGPQLIIIEVGLTAMVATVAFGWPHFGDSFFRRTEFFFCTLARKKGWAVFSVGISAFLLRLALIPVIPVPTPFSANDFSFLLASDTFAHGRLTNPTPSMWVHFESIHITMKPTYMSMYFPGQGIVMAAGKVLVGHPWYGILCMSALMCAAICWMLQAWMPPSWALLGGMLAILRLGLFSYWINTYSGAGAIAALGGALVLGALPRFMRGAPLRQGLLLAIGVVLLALTRPYEGLLLCLAAAVLLVHWVLFSKYRPAAATLVRSATLPLLLMIGAAAWMGYYDYRAFGNPFTLPYTVDRTTYAVAPYYIWQKQRPAPVYRHEVMRQFYSAFEPGGLPKGPSVSSVLHETLVKAKAGILFFAGAALLLPLVMLHRVVLDRRTRFLVVCVCLLAAGMAIETYLIPHYLAPFTAAFYAIGLQAMRHLRLWRPEGRNVGLSAVRLIVALCFLLAGIRLFAGPLGLIPPEWPAGLWNSAWYGPGVFGLERAKVENGLDRLTGNHLVVVRYSPQHYPLDEWVYNSADVDHSKVVWAREMDAASNRELFDYYKGRNVWLVEPDAEPTRITAYPVTASAPVVSR